MVGGAVCVLAGGGDVVAGFSVGNGVPAEGVAGVAGEAGLEGLGAGLPGPPGPSGT